MRKRYEAKGEESIRPWPTKLEKCLKKL